MAVYVDDMRASFGRMIMCHMLADTIAELHAMADTIGVQRKWFQGCRKASWPHYDIAMSKRALAVQAGAVELDRYALSAMLRRWREQGRFVGASRWSATAPPVDVVDPQRRDLAIAGGVQ